MRPFTGCVVFREAWLFTLASAFGFNTWYANADATAPFDGSSLAHGLQKVQQVVDAAKDGDVVDVARGAYTENLTVSKRLGCRLPHPEGGGSGREPLTPSAPASALTIGPPSFSIKS